MQKIKIVNISGWGRSGSTILGSILGQCNGFFYGGEIKNLWKMSLLKDRLCGCGVPLKECTLWKEVFDVAFSGFDNIDAKKIAKAIEHTSSSRELINELFKNGRNFKSLTSSYEEELKKLFSAIQSVNKCRVIIDSTKAPLYGYMLSAIPDFDVYTIHLIRDSRGIAYSRKKMKVQPDANSTIYMQRFSPFNSSFMWVTRNLMTEFFWKKKKDRYLCLRYEDFTKNPKKTVETILDFIGEKETKSPFISERTATLTSNHSIWGNPSRFKTGDVEIKLDNEWEEKLGKKDFLISSLVSFPLLVKYGYKLSR